MTTLIESRNDILTLLKTAWDADSEASLIEMIYTNVPQSQPINDDDHPWARASIIHGAGGQIGMGGAQNLHDREGILVVQLFVPLNYVMSKLDALKELIISTFEGVTSPNGVRFGESRITKVGNDGNWYQENVAVDFTFEKLV